MTELIRRTLFNRLSSIPTHEIPTDFDKPLVDKIIDSFYEELDESSIEEIVKFLSETKPEKPEFVWAILLRIAYRVYQNKWKNSTSVHELELEKVLNLGRKLHTSHCTIVQQLRLELMLLLVNSKIDMSDIITEVINLLTQENTNIFVRPIAEKYAIATIRSKIFSNAKILHDFVNILLSADYSIVENSISNVLVNFVGNLLHEDRMKILQNLFESLRAGLAFCKLGARIISMREKFSWSDTENQFVCKRTKRLVLQEIILLNTSDSNAHNLNEELLNLYTDVELGELFLFIENLSPNLLDLPFMKNIVGKAITIIDVARRPFSSNAFSALFKIIERIEFSTQDYIQLFMTWKNWITTSPQILSLPPCSMHKEIYSNPELKNLLEELVLNGLIAMDWETRDSAIEILSITGEFLSIEPVQLLSRLIELAESDECSYVRFASIKYLIKRLPENLLFYVAKLYKLNLDSDFRSCLLDFLQDTALDFPLESLIIIVEETLDHEDDPGVLEKVATLCEMFLNKFESEALRNVYLLLKAEIEIAHHERNQRKENLEDVRMQVEDLIETMERTCQTGLDDCIIKECY